MFKLQEALHWIESLSTRTILLKDIALTICASCGKARAREVDVTDSIAVSRLVQKPVERSGRLDYIFNNAGIGIGGNIARYGLENWKQMMDLNLRGGINGVCVPTK